MSGTLLVPLDGSDLAEQALPYAAVLGRTLDADILLLFARSAAAAVSSARFSPMASLTAAVEQTLPNDMKSYLTAQADALRASGLRASTAVVEGRPARVIADAAAGAAVRLVVLATHGRGGLGRLLLGSVADEVLRTTRRPTLVIAPIVPVPAAVSAPVVLHRLLVPLDGSDHAEAALPVAVAIATAAWAPLTLARVVPFLPHPVPPLYPLTPRVADEEQRLCREAQVYLMATRSRLPAQIEVETVVVRGDAGDQLVTAAQQHDLVVMTSRGRGGLARAVFGSVADRLVRAAVPVLLVPAPTVPEPVD